MKYYCYIIFNGNASYVGITNNLKQRLRKHNQEIVGGAKYTKMIGRGWEYACHVSGFNHKKEALQFEWALKHVGPRHKVGIENRIEKLIILLNRQKWCRKAPLLMKNYKMNLTWKNWGLIPEDLKIPDYIEHDVDII